MDNEPNNDANERVLALVQDWQQSIDPISTVDSDSIRSLQLTAENDEFNFIRPQFTKDIYYSIFVDTLLQLGRENGGDIYITLEAILSMAFTPSPSGWLDGIERASSSGSGQNFIVSFINEMRNAYGCVSSGGHTRRQVSHQRSASIQNIMASLHNLLALIDLANTSDDTAFLVKQFTKSPSQGGVFLAGDLMATEMIHVLSKLNIITNQIHMRNASVCRGTRTFQRLKLLGIRTDAERETMMTYLVTELNLQRDVVENGLCEALRWRYSNRRFYETIVDGQLIYTYGDNGTLNAYDLDGVSVPVSIPEWVRSASSYQRGSVRWWEDDYEKTYKHLITSRSIKLTTN